MSFPEAAERLTVKVPVEPSSSAEISLIESEGALSSSVIVKVPVASLILAFDALDKVRVTVSLFSSVLSPKTGTVNVFEVSPASKVKVPELDV